MNNKTKNIFIISSIIAVAVLGSVFVAIGMDWFNNLLKPEQWVPNILIPIVWTIIYVTFGVILLLWSNKEKLPTNVVVLLIVNGILNVLWCLLFFTCNLTLVGNICIVVNLIAGFALIGEILKSKKLYGYILTIYPIWLSIATTLNTALWILN